MPAILAPFWRPDVGCASCRAVGAGDVLCAGPCSRPRKSRRSTQPSSLSSGGAPSARTGRAARWRPRGIRAGRSPSTWPRSTAASGRRPTRAARGTRSSTTSRPVRSASSRSRHPIPTSSTSAAAKACIVRISRPATASTSRPTRGRTWTHLGLTDAQQIPEPRHRSAQSGSRVHRGARPSLRSKRGTRDLPFDRWRPHVPEGPLQGREHRRQRRRHRSVEPRRRLRDDVGRAAGTVGERRLGGRRAAGSSSPRTAARTGRR